MLNIESSEYREVAMAMNFELEVIFRKNLAFFENEDESLYSSALNYRPQRLTLRLDPKGYVNLFNLNTSQAVYPEEPNLYAQKQVKHFFQKRPHFTISIELGSELKDEYPYSKCINAIHNKYSELLPERFFEKQNRVDNLFMFGGGLYLQLQYILNELDVKRLTIFEVDFDSFYASLHVIDWSEIYKYFDREGYSLDLMFVTDTESSYLKIGKSMLSWGLHKYAKVDLFFHYKNQQIDYVYKQIKHYAKGIVSTLGYFEDERIGLAHTLGNIKKGIPFTRKQVNSINDDINIPVLVIGNGPSLDESEELIRKNKDKFIIISCGTSLSALYKKGIKPDIHVEQERVQVVEKLLRENTSKEYRQGIYFVGLSPCFPEVFELFEKRYIALKSGDIGVDVIVGSGLKNTEVVSNCNPLVSNFGLSLASSLGFKNIYLAGVDCGVAKADQHHSKDSFYFDDDGLSWMESINVDTRVKGNFCDLVYSNDLFNQSRTVLELEISESKLVVSNFSNGAYISGAIPCRECDFDIENLIKCKSQILKEKFEKIFSFDEVSYDLIKIQTDELLKVFNKGIDYFESAFDIKDKTLDQLLLCFDEMENRLKGYSIACPAMYRLTHGSLRGMMINITVAKKTLPPKSYKKFEMVAIESLDLFFCDIKRQMNEMLLAY